MCIYYMPRSGEYVTIKRQSPQVTVLNRIEKPMERKQEGEFVTPVFLVRTPVFQKTATTVTTSCLLENIPAQCVIDGNLATWLASMLASRLRIDGFFVRECIQTAQKGGGDLFDFINTLTELIHVDTDVLYIFLGRYFSQNA